MPTYEYKCACGNVYTALAKFEHGAPHNVTCDKCSEPMKRVYSFSTTNMPTGAGSKMGKR